MVWHTAYCLVPRPSLTVWLPPLPQEFGRWRSLRIRLCWNTCMFCQLVIHTIQANAEVLHIQLNPSDHQANYLVHPI